MEIVKSEIDRLKGHVLGPSSDQVPPECQLDVLKQVTSDLDRAYVRGMILGADVVVLQDALGAEIVDEGLAWLLERRGLLGRAVPYLRRRQVHARVEVSNYLLQLLLESLVLTVTVPVLIKPEPEFL